MSRCRICTANDRDALVEQLAGELWESRRDRTVDAPWDEAPVYWQAAFRQFAETAFAALEHLPAST